MTVYQNSRYVSNPVASPVTAKLKVKPGGKVIEYPPPTPTLFARRPTRRNSVSNPIPYNEQLVIQGDRMDLLASRLFGDPGKWWMIADLNPEIMFPFDELVPGSILRVPVSAALSYTTVSETFVPQIFARVFDGQGNERHAL